MQSCMAFDWDDVRMFLAVHRAKSLTSAGKSLGVDQSTMGRRLAAFEAKIGSKLFVRSPAGFVPTQAGERLSVLAEQMEAQALAIDRAITGAEQTLEGTLRITTSDAFGSVIMTPLLAKFHERWPAIQLELVASNSLLSLSKREADMAIRFNRTNDQGVVMKRVADVGAALYASKAYVAKYGMPPDDFDGHFLIGMDDNGSDARWINAHLGKGRIAFRADSTLAQLEAMKAGMGIGLLPCYLVTDPTDIVTVRMSPDGLEQSLWLVIHEDLQHSARVRALADFLVAELARLAPRLRGDTRARRK